MEHSAQPPVIDEIPLDMSRFQPAVAFEDENAQADRSEEAVEAIVEGDPVMQGDYAFEGELPRGPLTVDQVAAAQEPPPAPRPSRRQQQPTPDNIAMVVPDYLKNAQSGRPMTETQKKAEAAVFTQATKGLINQQNKAKEEKNKKIDDVDSDEKRRYDKYVACSRYLRYFSAHCPTDRVQANAREEVYDKFIAHVREQQDSA